MPKYPCALVPNQSDAEITEKFTRYFNSIAPTSVKVSVKPHHGGEPYVSPTDILPAYVAASKAMESTYGKKPVPVRSGGSIPIVALFEAELNVKSILLGLVWIQMQSTHPTSIMAFLITLKASKPSHTFLKTMFNLLRGRGIKKSDKNKS